VYVIESAVPIESGSTWSFIFDGLCRWLRLPHATLESLAGEEQSSKEGCLREQLLRRVQESLRVAKVSGLVLPGDNDSNNFSLVFGTDRKAGRHHIESICGIGPGRNPRETDKPCTNR